ncbi:MAG TPA: DUF2332 family protein [Dongiaceae bacterium]|nr:DUF2332 family protein [Dongiaceae bacterium]
MPHSPEALAAALRRQAVFCAELGSPLWSEAMEAVAADIETGGGFGGLLAGWEGDLERGVLALRLFGGLHYLALAGKAPALAAQLPSTGGTRDGALWSALCEALAQHENLLRSFLDHPPQTNEVRRSAIFLGGFLEIAARSGLPFALCEIGASAGLNLCWDRFAYHLGAHRWAGTDPALTLIADWRGPPPRLDLSPVVASRQACDLRPIRLGEREARLRLQGYVWPDHLDRLAQLRAAMALGHEMEIRVDEAEALDWTAQRLAARPEGQAMVIYHSVVLQYLDAAAQARFAAMIEAAGAKATASRPLAWLSYELASAERGYALDFAYWPGGERRRLAIAQPHGRWIEWMGSS